ncbi:hypothetical protein ACNKHR_12555 [Shigella flexneri]
METCDVSIRVMPLSMTSSILATLNQRWRAGTCGAIFAGQNDGTAAYEEAAGKVSWPVLRCRRSAAKKVGLRHVLGVSRRTAGDLCTSGTKHPDRMPLRPQNLV